MLSTIGRAAIRRGAGARSSTNRVIQSTWLLQRTNSRTGSNFQRESSLRIVDQRAFATTSKTVAKSKTTTTTGNPKAKTTTRSTKAKTKPAKKPIKKKLAAKKPAPKKKVVKPLTEEQKKKAVIRELKKTALKPPKGLGSTPWIVFCGDNLSADNAVSLKNSMSDIAAKYQSLSSAELEALNHRANENKRANDAALQKWLSGYTPIEIKTANNARNQLSKLLNRKYSQLPDERLVRGPTNAYVYFVKDRLASGDLKGISAQESLKLIGAEWKQVSASDKKVYQDRAAADSQRYYQEYKTVYGKASRTEH
ncbi:hypothetical protein BGZ60DRAFT_433127 [Tricladium varicosporioides]|nr:hypothetical protein BGZ60DRAFT_433127 [Hymenoscyphus varicosporioides]